MLILLPKKFGQNSVEVSTPAWQMTHEFTAFADGGTQMPGSGAARLCSALPNAAALRRTILPILFVVLLFGATTMRAAFADGLTRGTAAYSRGDYVRAVAALSA